MNYLDVLKQAVPCNCGKSKLIVNKEGDETQIVCWSCDRKGPFGKTTEEVVDKWNNQECKSKTLKEIYKNFKNESVAL